MIDTVETLILDLLEWVANRQRTYDEVMNAWRTSCPRLPVWEDANDRGLITTEYVDGRSIVRITSSGLALLERRRPSSECKTHSHPDPVRLDSANGIGVEVVQGDHLLHLPLDKTNDQPPDELSISS